MKFTAIVNVRLGSSRLPGKALKQVVGQPVLGHLLDRLRRCEKLDDIVVATSTQPENDAVEAFCKAQNVGCFRGSEDDVLDRMVAALQSREATHGVEIFGDCPLIDPALVDDMISRFQSAYDLDWLGNDITTSYPPGMEVEVFKTSALEDSANRTDDMSVREHGTLFIRQHPNIYRIENITAEGAHHRPELELELDTLEDLEVITAILTHFDDRPGYTLSDLIGFMDAHPDLSRLNTDVERRWAQYRTGETG